MSLEIGCVDHDGFGLGFLGGEAFHHPSEYPHRAPPLPAVVQCLVRPVFLRRIAPTQAVPVDEDDPAQDPPVIDPRLSMTAGEIRRQTRHLLVRQPIQIAHAQSPRGA